MTTTAPRPSAHHHGVWDREGHYHFHPGWQVDCHRYPCSTIT